MSPRTPRRESGMSGVETAIVFVAFVTVSAVFAFAAMRTSIFTSEHGSSAIADGFGATRGGVQLSNGIRATTSNGRIVALQLDVALGPGGDPVVLDPNTTERRTVISYTDAGAQVRDLAYTAVPVFGDGDFLLEDGELIQVNIDLTQDPAIDVGPNDRFALEVLPDSGARMVIQRTAPASLARTTIELH
jgi:flagellin FlaB